MMRKLSIAAVTTVIASCIGYLAAAWVIIYGLMPEHPDFSPQKLFHEALWHLPFLVFVLVAFQLSGFACIARRVADLPVGYVISISAEISGLIAMIHGLLSELTAFDPLWWQLMLASAPVVIMLVVLLTAYRTRGSHAIAV